MFSWVCRFGFMLFSLGLEPAVAQGEKLLVEGDSMVRDWKPPTLTGALAKQKIKGSVTIEFIVDEKGQVQDPRVTETTDARLDDIAVKTLREWIFDAAVEGGVAMPSCLRVKIIFDPTARAGLIPPSTPEPLPKTRPQPVTTPDATYPSAYMEKQLPGRVECDYSVDVDGSVVEVVVTGATSPVFIPSALAAIRKWKFRPAKQGHLTVKTRHTTAFDFAAVVAGIEGLKRATLESFGVAPQPNMAADSWDTAPIVSSVVEPVTPFVLGIAGKEGSATVDFTVTAAGSVESVSVREASAPEFGKALAVAARGWLFKPAIKDNARVRVPLSLTWVFPNMLESESASPVWKRLADGNGVSPASGLDRPLRPIYREAPAYPEKLKADKVVGNATLDFVIDEQGRVQVPRVTQASHEEFGYEAVQALSHWQFEPPMRGGEPVAIKIAIPFSFSAPQ